MELPVNELFDNLWVYYSKGRIFSLKRLVHFAPRSCVFGENTPADAPQVPHYMR